MNELAIAFDDALDAAESVKGFREKVTFRNQEIDALFFDFMMDIEPGAGGYMDAVPIKISIRLDDCIPPPTPLEAITIRGIERQILFFEQLEARFDLTCGRAETDMT
jgi:hypothetical protein